MTTLTICGSMTFAKQMKEWKEKLEKKGFRVFAPSGLDNPESNLESGSSKEATNTKIVSGFIQKHHNYIKQSEGILVLNYDKKGIPGYVGGNSLMEMGFAFTQNRDIFLLNPSPDLPYKSEIDSMQPIIIDCDFERIVNYYKNLPEVFLSSQSEIKLSATSLALREFNLRYNVVGFKTETGVDEEPYSIGETYSGAENRLKYLKQNVKNKKPKMCISIESGNEILHPKHNYWGVSVCIIEDENGKRSVGINSEMEMPKEFTDLVPSKYPDLGVLVQQKYGIRDKDPFTYLTSGKLTRDWFIFNLVVNTLGCLQ